MYDDFFYDHTCSISTIVLVVVDWSEKKTKTTLYSDIRCAIRSIDSNNLTDGPTGRRWDWATHKINLEWQYNVPIGSIISIADREYDVIDGVSYTDTNNTPDNSSFYIRVR